MACVAPRPGVRGLKHRGVDKMYQITPSHPARGCVD